MEYQLRRNRIRPGHLEEFLDAWLSGVVPLRRRFGFTFGGAWTAVHEHMRSILDPN
jgi:hypothetical protein